ncbi:unnamed protein product [Ostreobium quekettii]|uniref:Ferredoxin n=1 Tax=Ostreobium quekettii TaxID=121088 RepID=A0A8S1J767_9CHLO|nr:unnamed protein product [Ostreobium quekettii]|eukprot:evm.model.scf_437EXC.7 EVM.evm.TU.scf_437EXC.7   scf_437EXC:32564-33253(+)
MQPRSVPATSTGTALRAVSRLPAVHRSLHGAQRPRPCAPVRAYQITYVGEDGSEVRVQASESDFLLDVGEENSVDIPASCRGGMCGTCVCKLTSGEVDMSEAGDLEGVLSPEQLAAGYILTCSSRPKSDCTVEWKQDWGVSVLDEWKG